MPILGSSNSAGNKDMISKIWTNGDTTEKKTLWENKKLLKGQFLLFSQSFQKMPVVNASK